MMRTGKRSKSFSLPVTTLMSWTLTEVSKTYIPLFVVVGKGEAEAEDAAAARGFAPSASGRPRQRAPFHIQQAQQVGARIVNLW